MEHIKRDSLYFTFLEVIRMHYYRTHVLLDKIGMYPGQPPMLFMLNKKDGQSQKELAETLNLKPATITVMLKRMESANIVLRKPDLKDQRISRVYLTKEGKKLCEEAVHVMKENLSQSESELINKGCGRNC